MKILFLALLLLSCTSKKNQDELKNTLISPISSNISSLDPAVAFDQVSLKVIYQIYETLYEYDYNDPQKIIPLLADGMPKVSDDKLSYIIKIKKGIKYHPNARISSNRTVKSHDFITQIKRLAFTATRSQGFWLFDGKIQGINKFKKQAKTIDQMLGLSIKGLTAIDDYTLKLTLTKPYPQIMYALCMAFVVPVPAEAISLLDNNLAEETIATGPFRLKTFKRSQMIELEKFSGYHTSKLPYIKTVKMPFMKEAQTRWLNFRKGNVDFFGLGKDHFSLALDKEGNLKQELKSEKISLYKQNSLTYWWLTFNMQDSLVGKNLDLRKAIAHAINWEKYIQIFTNGTGIKANSIYHPSVFGYEKGNESFYPYNPEKSIEMLKQAGFPEGKDLPTILFDTRTISKQSVQQAEFIKAELKKIGVNIKIQTNTFPTFLKKAREGKLQLWQDGWGLDYPDSENIIQLLLTKNHPPGVNPSYYSSEIIDKGFDQISVIENNDKKKRIMREIENQLKEDYVWIMQFYSRGYTLYQSRVKNFTPSALTNNYFKYLKL